MLEVCGKDEFSSWGSFYNKKPLIYKLPWSDFSPQSFFESLSPRDTVLFESSKLGDQGRFSLIGVRPKDFFAVRGDKVSSFSGERVSTDPLVELREVIESWKSPSLSSFAPIPLAGGALGFFSYESARFFSPISFPLLQRDNQSFYDVYLWFFDQLFIFDHTLGELYLCSSGETYEEALAGMKRMEKDVEKFASFIPLKKEGGKSRFCGSNFEYEAYLKAIEKCRDYIERGHSYQINLAQELGFESEKNSWEIYKSLVEINPVSYGAYFSCGGFDIICGSPELLVKKQGKKLSARPIAGTRRRGSDEENERFRRELEEDRKEVAEHAMLVDLVRNDLARVSKAGSVKIDAYAKIIDYTHVMHIESDLSSEVEETAHPLDVLGALFPGGTVTGVPKLRTMEIIHELEEKERNLYTGSIGYISYEKNLEFNIVIRSLLCSQGKLFSHVGGGLTYDCIPRREYKETLNKVRSQLLALEIEDLP